MKVRSGIKRAAALLFAVMLVVSLGAVDASAATDCRFKSLPAGKWAASSYQYNDKTGIHYTYYIIRVKKPGILRFDLSGQEVWLKVTNSRSDLENHTDKHAYVAMTKDSEQRQYAVEPGTYYAYVINGKMKYTFKAVSAAKNYSLSRAAGLKSGKTVTEAFAPTNNYSRWYKISNPTKKRIAIQTNTKMNAENIEIYNAKYQRLETVPNGSTTKIRTRAKVPKGTYYIRIMSQYRWTGALDFGAVFGNVATLRWK